MNSPPELPEPNPKPSVAHEWIEAHLQQDVNQDAGSIVESDDDKA